MGGSDTPFCASERFLTPPQTLSSLVLSALRYSMRSWVTLGGSQEAPIIAHHHCHACPRSMTIVTMGHQPHGCWSPSSVRWLSPLLGGIHPMVGGWVGRWWGGWCAVGTLWRIRCQQVRLLYTCSLSRVLAGSVRCFRRAEHHAVARGAGFLHSHNGCERAQLRPKREQGRGTPGDT